jgi:hypothetical protein
VRGSSRRTLRCAIQALESVLAILAGLELQIGIAQQAGNADLGDRRLHRVFDCGRVRVGLGQDVERDAYWKVGRRALIAVQSVTASVFTDPTALGSVA